MDRLAIESRRKTWLHRVSPRVKLVVTLALVAAIALMPRRLDLLYLAPALVLLLCWMICRMPFGYGLRRLLVVEPIILGMGLLVWLRPDAAPIFYSVIIKSNLCLLAMLLLTYTTPFHELLLVMRHARMPAVMLTTLALMYRYLGVLAEESMRMQRARASRTFSRRHRLAWRNLAIIAGQLFLRTADRAERIYLAMCARGWK